MILEMFQYIVERSQDFTTALSQHLEITFISLGISIVLGLTAGILATRVTWLRKGLMFVANIGRTIPSLAILALALPLLGIGRPPSILALVLIGTLPVLINTTVGIEQVDEKIKEAARGMGMTRFQILTRVELPIAVAIIMAGIRTAAVLLVASTTLAAFIGAGGLGDLILRGHALNKDHIVLAGAIPATLLAFYFEEAFGRLEKWSTPIGLKIGTAGFIRERTSLFELLSVILVIPLIFGILLPWVSYIDAEGVRQLYTGLHPQYRMMSLIALLLGAGSAIFLSTKNLETAKRVIHWKVISHGLALALLSALLTMILLNLSSTAQIRSGLLVQLGAQFLLVLLSIVESRSFKNAKE